MFRPLAKKIITFIYQCICINLDTFCFQVEKLRENISEVRNLLANKDNESADTIKSSVHELQQKSLKLFEMAYKKVFKGSCLWETAVSFLP